MSPPDTLRPSGMVWKVGALCRAIGDSIDARFNPVTVVGELSSFSRATSGHCYFALKDEAGQLRCAMFRRAAGLLEFQPREGDLVEARGRLAIYEPRGDLQMVVESLRRAGQGTLFEQFLQRKAKLEAEGLFDPLRKRDLPRMPRRIGVVTSLGAAALHDVLTALNRRVPHIEVVVAPAAVQGAGAPFELTRALEALGRDAVDVDLILLVRGGGSIEDLWAFNDEGLARAIVGARVPVVTGIGHETDFTIADFCADLRAPTPTAAAELAASPRDNSLAALDQLEQLLASALGSRLDGLAQRLDMAATRIGRPSMRVQQERQRIFRSGQQLSHAMRLHLASMQSRVDALDARVPGVLASEVVRQRRQLEGIASQLRALDPAAVLERGYAWLTDQTGHAVTRVEGLQTGDLLHAQFADGQADMSVVHEVMRGKRPTPGL